MNLNLHASRSLSSLFLQTSCSCICMYRYTHIYINIHIDDCVPVFDMCSIQNGVRGLMLDMYDFENGVWLCHSFGGNCYNFTAFVRSYLGQNNV